LDEARALVDVLRSADGGQAAACVGRLETAVRSAVTVTPDVDAVPPSTRELIRGVGACLGTASAQSAARAGVAAWGLSLFRRADAIQGSVLDI